MIRDESLTRPARLPSGAAIAKQRCAPCDNRPGVLQGIPQRINRRWTRSAPFFPYPQSYVDSPAGFLISVASKTKKTANAPKSMAVYLTLQKVFAQLACSAPEATMYVHIGWMAIEVKAFNLMAFIRTSDRFRTRPQSALRCPVRNAAEWDRP
jgi:hypothetical protein